MDILIKLLAFPINDYFAIIVLLIHYEFKLLLFSFSIFRLSIFSNMHRSSPILLLLLFHMTWMVLDRRSISNTLQFCIEVRNILQIIFIFWSFFFPFIYIIIRFSILYPLQHFIIFYWNSFQFLFSTNLLVN
jgi:hypothetical protein